MSGPYVQVVIDHRQKQRTRTDTKPTPKVRTTADEWLVVHDSRGHIVVRERTRRDEIVVIATGTWRDNKIVDRVSVTEERPSSDDWATLEQLMYPPIRQTKEASNAVDHGQVRRPGDPPSAAAGEIKNPVLRVLASIGVVIALLAVAAGVWYWKSLDSGNVANDAACSVNSDCKSGRCERDANRNKRCVAAGVRGDSCTRDRECSSGTCKLRSCE